MPFSLMPLVPTPLVPTPLVLTPRVLTRVLTHVLTPARWFQPQTAWGYDHVVDDPTMGWSRYCHGSRLSTKDPGFAFLQASAVTPFAPQ